MEQRHLDKILSAAASGESAESDPMVAVYLRVLRDVRDRHPDSDEASGEHVEEMVCSILTNSIGRGYEADAWKPAASKIAAVLMADEHARERIQRLWERLATPD